MRARSWLTLAATILAVTASPSRADAVEWIIKNPGDHPSYTFEAEPHGLVGLGGPFKDKGDFGAGFRGTIVVASNGFIKKINDSVGVSFGADFFFGDKGKLFLPVAMQWNFWLTSHWSVFGEPGLALSLKEFEAKDDVLHPILMVGGRYHFTEKLSLTMRAGYPAFSIGVSFFL